MLYQNSISYSWSFAIKSKHKSKPRLAHQYKAKIPTQLTNTKILKVSIPYQYTHTVIQLNTTGLVNLRNEEPILDQYEVNTLSQSIHFSPNYHFFSNLLIYLPPFYTFYLYYSSTSWHFSVYPWCAKIIQHGRNTINKNPHLCPHSTSTCNSQVTVHW